MTELYLKPMHCQNPEMQIFWPKALVHGAKAKQKDNDMKGNISIVAIFKEWQSEIICDDPPRAVPGWKLNLDDTCQAQIKENS